MFVSIWQAFKARLSKIFAEPEEFEFWWRINEDGELILGETRIVVPESSQVTKDELELALLRLQSWINLKEEFNIEVVMIAPNVAVSFWQQGCLTLNHLRWADKRYSGVTFSMQLCDEVFIVSIQPFIYNQDFEFRLTGGGKPWIVKDPQDYFYLRSTT